MANRGVIFWDFDGTLAYREGMWSRTLLDVLDARMPGHGVTRELIRPHLNAGFPWHEPKASHLDLCEPDSWWASLEGVFASAYEAVGIDGGRCLGLAREVRATYLDRAAWAVYDDVEACLTALDGHGWRQAILSNHVPELPALVEALGLSRHFERVICSAAIGYEKPHPEAYRIALAAMDTTADESWMVGDSLEADVLGAETVGLCGILVRRTSERVRRCCPDLRGVVEAIEGERI